MQDGISRVFIFKQITGVKIMSRKKGQTYIENQKTKIVDFDKLPITDDTKLHPLMGLEKIITHLQNSFLSMWVLCLMRKTDEFNGDIEKS